MGLLEACKSAVSPTPCAIQSSTVTSVLRLGPYMPPGQAIVLLRRIQQVNGGVGAGLSKDVAG